MGRDIERAQNVVRILEVTHKMQLERATLDGDNTWIAICEAFGVAPEGASEVGLYQELVLSQAHPYSVLRCIAAAREEGRSKRDLISEELWTHLNGYFLSVGGISFDEIRHRGRTEFGHQVEVFCDAFHGLADDTMMHGPGWHFLRMGKFLERATMICRILEIKRKTLQLAPEEEGRPLDFHQWQALLRSLSAWEAYRRTHDARIVPSRVLEFVLGNPRFPRSVRYCLAQLAESLPVVGATSSAQLELGEQLEELLAEIGRLDGDIMFAGGLDSLVRHLTRRFEALDQAIDRSYFSSLRPAPAHRGAGADPGPVPQ